ncbi:MAG: GH102, partial [uncultured Ramlibacter sp.]
AGPRRAHGFAAGAGRCADRPSLAAGQEPVAAGAVERPARLRGRCPARGVECLGAQLRTAAQRTGRALSGRAPALDRIACGAAPVDAAAAAAVSHRTAAGNRGRAAHRLLRADAGGLAAADCAPCGAVVPAAGRPCIAQALVQPPGDGDVGRGARRAARPRDRLAGRSARCTDPADPGFGAGEADGARRQQQDRAAGLRGQQRAPLPQRRQLVAAAGCGAGCVVAGHQGVGTRQPAAAPGDAVEQPAHGVLPRRAAGRPGRRVWAARRAGGAAHAGAFDRRGQGEHPVWHAGLAGFQWTDAAAAAPGAGAGHGRRDRGRRARRLLRGLGSRGRRAGGAAEATVAPVGVVAAL